jgi:tetratricopeptide (TPR) repeat protein
MFESTRGLRGALGEHDRFAYAIAEALIANATPDWGAAEERATEGIAAFPEDAELAWMRGWVRWAREDFVASRADFERALAIDPKFAFALGVESVISRAEGHGERALAEVDRCLAIAHGSTTCLANRARLNYERGDCATVERDADTMIATAPTDPAGYWYREHALAWGGASDETLRALLERRVSMQSGRYRESVRVGGLLEIAMLHARFDEAVRLESDATKALANVHGVNEHARDALLRAQAMLEMGRREDAGKIARTFLERRGVWVDGANDIDGDDTPKILGIARHTHAIDDAAWRAQRDEWVAAARRRFPGPESARAITFAAFLTPVETREEAIEALAQLPSVMPLALEVAYAGDLVIGKARFLAGQIDDAIPMLQRAAKACFVLDAPVDTARAVAMLGDALAQRDDKAGACAAYGAVMARWKSASPRSVTLESVKKSAAKLGCAP